jgi:hypothetical protein
MKTAILLLLANACQAQHKSYSVSRLEILVKNEVDRQYIFHHYKQFRKLLDTLVIEGTRSTDARIRFAAILTAGERKDPRMRNELLNGILDGQTSQAARLALVRIYRVDFGPIPEATVEERRASQRMWTVFVSEALQKSILK